VLDFAPILVEVPVPESPRSTLDEAIAAIRNGDRLKARELLRRLLNTDSSNPEYWVWMSAVASTESEKIRCLESALKLDPKNKAARRGLTVLGAMSLDRSQVPPPLKIRRRQIASVATGAAMGGTHINWVMTGASLLGVIAIVSAVGLYIAFRPPPVLPPAPTLPPVPTATVVPSPTVPPPTATPIPASTRIFRTPVPAEMAQTPLVFLVPMSPTPTPLLGVTPHPSYEDFAAGVEALKRGDYEQTIAHMDQVIGFDPSLPDAHYLRAEALRLSGDYADSIAEYDKAILAKQDYAPAYLGRGRAILQINPDELPQDFERAIQYDPGYIDAYVAEADYYASKRLWKTMEEKIQAAIDSGVRSPLLYIRLSQAQINGEKFALALENAIEGSADDPSLLDGYYVLGRAYDALENYEAALWPLQTYVVYASGDYRGWAYLGDAQLGVGDFESAAVSLEQALQLNDRYAPAYLARGYMRMQSGEYAEAISDFNKAAQYGPESYRLSFGFGKTYYLMNNYPSAIRPLNTAISLTTDQRKVADCYALLALIFESNPDNVDDAILRWQWILQLPGAAPETRSLAEQHLLELTGSIPTVPTATPGPGTSSPSATPSPQTSTPVPGTPTPSPSVTPT
jgi:tetratricopeptide (TPR) repeat protein